MIPLTIPSFPEHDGKLWGAVQLVYNFPQTVPVYSLGIQRTKEAMKNVVEAFLNEQLDSMDG